MRILVCIKQVPESESFVDKNSRGDWLRVNDNATFRMNRFDEYAVEEAIRMGEDHPGTTVDAVTVGPERSRAVLIRAMGMGAAGGFHIQESHAAYVSPFDTAAKISAFVLSRNYDLILTGIMSEDMMQAQTGPMLARMAGMPFLTGVVSLSASPGKGIVTADRVVEGGIRETFEIRLPALLAIQAGINTPRYPTLSNMLAARKKEIVEIAPADRVRAAVEQVREIAVPEKTRAGYTLEGSTAKKARQFMAIMEKKLAV